MLRLITRACLNPVLSCSQALRYSPELELRGGCVRRRGGWQGWVHSVQAPAAPAPIVEVIADAESPAAPSNDARGVASAVPGPTVTSAAAALVVEGKARAPPAGAPPSGAHPLARSSWRDGAAQALVRQERAPSRLSDKATGAGIRGPAAPAPAQPALPEAGPTRSAPVGQVAAVGSLAQSVQTSSQLGGRPRAASPREPLGTAETGGWFGNGPPQHGTERNSAPAPGGSAAEAHPSTAASQDDLGCREPLLESDSSPRYTADGGIDGTGGVSHAHPLEEDAVEAPTPPATPPDKPRSPAADPAGEHGQWETAGCARGRRQRWKGSQLPAGLFTGAMRAPGCDTEKEAEATSVLSDRTATIHEDEWASSSVSSQDPEAARSIAQAGKGLHSMPVARPAAPTPTQQVAAGSAVGRRRGEPQLLFPARNASPATGVPAVAPAARQQKRVLKSNASAPGFGRLACSLVASRALTFFSAVGKFVAQARLATSGLTVAMPPLEALRVIVPVLLLCACLFALAPIAGLSKPDLAVWAALSLLTSATHVSAWLVRAPSQPSMPPLPGSTRPRAQSRRPGEQKNNKNGPRWPWRCTCCAPDSHDPDPVPAPPCFLCRRLTTQPVLASQAAQIDRTAARLGRLCGTIDAHDQLPETSPSAAPGRCDALGRTTSLPGLSEP